MEERARRRYALRTEREAKRRANEEEKLAKVQRKRRKKNPLFDFHYVFKL